MPRAIGRVRRARFPLLTYQDVKKHGRQIVAVTQTRFMPPWLPEPGELKFADERRLSDEQIATIRAWVDQGMLEGKPSDLPPKPTFVEGWQLGQPDVVLKAEKPYMLSATGSDQYWNFILPVPIHETRWVRAVEIRPGDKRLVHHANILVDRYESARRMEKDKGSGFGGMEVRIDSEVFDPDSHFLFWKPGTVVTNEPDGMALRLDKGTDLVLNTHLQPSGKEEPVQPSVGLYFTDKPATVHPMLLQMQNDAALDIPAGDSNFVVTDEFTLPIDVDLLGIYPHAHYLGKDMLATAMLPDGTTKTLIHIKHWDLNWQAVYRYAEPVFLPKNTVLKNALRVRQLRGQHGQSLIIRPRACLGEIDRPMKWRTCGCRCFQETIPLDRAIREWFCRRPGHATKSRKIPESLRRTTTLARCCRRAARSMRPLNSLMRR